MLKDVTEIMVESFDAEVDMETPVLDTPEQELLGAIIGRALADLKGLVVTGRRDASSDQLVQNAARWLFLDHDRHKLFSFYYCCDHICQEHHTSYVVERIRRKAYDILLENDNLRLVPFLARYGYPTRSL